MRSLALIGGLILPVAIMVPAYSQGGPNLTMTCHEMFRGAPSKEPTVYEIVGRDMYRTGYGRRVHISTEGKPLFLSKATDKGIETESFASHTVNGTRVTRTVYWRLAGGEMQPRFTEQFDFQAKTIASSTDKADRCHADGH